MTLTREPIAEVQVTLLRIPLAKGSLNKNDLSNGWLCQAGSRLEAVCEVGKPSRQQIHDLFIDG